MRRRWRGGTLSSASEGAAADMPILAAGRCTAGSLRAPLAQEGLRWSQHVPQVQAVQRPRDLLRQQCDDRSNFSRPNAN